MAAKEVPVEKAATVSVKVKAVKSAAAEMEPVKGMC
jgi:hypothetical protein